MKITWYILGVLLGTGNRRMTYISFFSLHNMLPSPNIVVQLGLLWTIIMNSGETIVKSGAMALVSGPPSADTSSSSTSSQQDPIPLLPPGDPDQQLPSIKLGETISFEDIGPVIINPDGTTRRISNWEEMTPQEQQTTWRRIKKRNEERRAKLLLEQERAEKSSADDDTASEL
jgi:hypothetical protein